MAAGQINTIMNLFKPKRASSILGLSLDGNRLEALVLRRSGDSLQLLQKVSVPLALSPLSGDPELVGREIRNHLNEAGIRERRCAVCLPLNWVLSVQTKLPDLPEEDIPGFLEIEAERGFPSGYEHLIIANSRCRSPGGEQYATLLGIPRNHIAILEKALKAAQLKPLTFSLGITALAGGGSNLPPGFLTLALAPHGIDLQITAGGGIAALRSLDAAIETEGAQKRIDADLVAREIRITLGQLPPAFGQEIRTARILGRGDMARQFVTDVARRLEGMGMRAELLERASDAPFTQALPAEIALSPALALAANYLRVAPAGPEFLPPKVQPWKQMLKNTNSSKRLLYAGAGVGAVAACIFGAFMFQSWQIWRLQTKLNAISAQVAELDDAAAQANKFSPWYDHKFRQLQILDQIAKSFPDYGRIASAKTITIHEPDSVTVSGIVNPKESYNPMFESLRAVDQVVNLQTETLHSTNPTQFTYNFKWSEGGKGNGQ
jgi:Tfp pilus assembly protein PilN